MSQCKSKFKLLKCIDNALRRSPAAERTMNEEPPATIARESVQLKYAESGYAAASSASGNVAAAATHARHVDISVGCISNVSILYKMGRVEATRVHKQVKMQRVPCIFTVCCTFVAFLI